MTRSVMTRSVHEKKFRLHPIAEQRFRRIVPKVLRWYRTNKRKFVWRESGVTPYTVLVSEFMLQQTQAQTIQRRLPLFLQQFPTIHQLANVSGAEVLRAWQGLGYNRRALHLHKAAKAISAMSQIDFPGSLAELQKLPGVGVYTASAILVFSFGYDLPVIDVNIARVLSRLYQPLKELGEALPLPVLTALDATILPKGKSNEWHQALMDLGATICTKRTPACARCPVREECKSARYLSKVSSSGTVRQSNARSEPLFFGKPKRIWRGRVLKYVADREKITEAAVIKLLLNGEKIGHSEQVEFGKMIVAILGALRDEGFLKKNRATYSLQS